MNYAGDVRINQTTKMLEIYDGTKWFQSKPGLRDTPIPTEKEIALDELFKGTPNDRERMVKTTTTNRIPSYSI